MSRYSDKTPAPTPGGGLGMFLFIVAMIIFVLVALIIYPVTSGTVAIPNVSEMRVDEGNVTYYAMFVFIATPVGLLYMLWRAKMRETMWDRIFFSSAMCLYLYAVTMIGFIIMAIGDTFTPLHSAGILQSLFKEPIVTGTFWLILFSTPPVLLQTPIGYAAHVEKGGFKGSAPGLAPLAFIMSSAASVYIIMRLLPIAGAPFAILVLGIAGILLALSWLTLLLLLIAQRSGFGWILVGVMVTAGIAAAVQFLAV